MRIVFIEPTPSPNSMKVNLDFRLPDGERYTYTSKEETTAPSYIRRLLEIPGVAGVFHTADFIAVDRQPKADWQSILQEVRQVFGEDATTSIHNAAKNSGASGENKAVDAGARIVSGENKDYTGVAIEGAELSGHYGEANVLVQKFRGIPLQIRVKSEEQEERIALPSRFIDAAMKAQYGSPNLIKERVLEDYGVRYGERKEIAEQIAAELEASYDNERLQQLIIAALGDGNSDVQADDRIELQAIALKLENPDWKIRYAALDKLKPDLNALPLIEKAMTDDNFSIRRLATVYLGDIGQPEVFPQLYRMLRDPSASVRRTAGDCLSDIGDPDAIKPMSEALMDPSKIVRWRAARYLYEVGDDSALDSLRKAVNDPEFEVAMQVQYAIARIEGGEAAAGSIWQQMTRRDR